jgi:hypothetical protein
MVAIWDVRNTFTVRRRIAKGGTMAHPPVSSAPFSGTCYELSPACYANRRK